MTTRADLRSRVRAELNDAGAAQLWTDADLNRWLAEGVRAWSYDWPAERSTTLATAKGQPNYGLPGDLITVRRVEHPTGIYRAPVPFASGDVAPEARLLDLGCGVNPAELIYDVYNGVLWLSPAPDAAGESITVRYDGLWIVPSSDVTVLDLVSQDEDPVVWVACASALRWIGTDEAKR